MVAVPIANLTEEERIRAYMEGWVRWAGGAETLYADNEKAYIGRQCLSGFL